MRLEQVLGSALFERKPAVRLTVLVIGEINSYKAGQRLASKHVNHYVTDGEVTAASLMVKV
jgi:hypothetical protein